MIRKILAWLFFWLGDKFSNIAAWTILENYEWPYNVYSALMTWSIDIQGDGLGPWSKPEPNEDHK